MGGCAMTRRIIREVAAIIADGTQLVCASHLEAHREPFTDELVLEPGHVIRSERLR